MPIVAMPAYCATKAVVQSFSVSLRQQLRSTPVKVFEAIPPTVETELDRGGREPRGQVDRGIPAAQAAAEIAERLRRDELEIAIGGAKNLNQAARLHFDQASRA